MEMLTSSEIIICRDEISSLEQLAGPVRDGYRGGGQGWIQDLKGEGPKLITHVREIFTLGHVPV